MVFTLNGFGSCFSSGLKVYEIFKFTLDGSIYKIRQHLLLLLIIILSGAKA